jgi:hypothetical protein
MRSCAARRRAVTKGVRDELQGVHEDHVHYGRWRVCLDFASDTLLFDAPNLEAATMVAVHATFTAARSVAELGWYPEISNVDEGSKATECTSSWCARRTPMGSGARPSELIGDWSHPLGFKIYANRHAHVGDRRTKQHDKATRIGAED